MEDDRSELIASFCTQAGMIMEDASVIALTVGRADQDGQAAKLTELHEAAQAMEKLIAAAQTLSS